MWNFIIEHWLLTLVTLSTLTFIIWAAWYKVKNGVYPPALVTVLKPINLNPNFKTGTYPAWLGAGVNQKSLQNASDATITLLGLVGGAIIFLSIVSSLIAMEAWTKIGGSAWHGLVIGGVLGMAVYMMDRQITASIMKKVSMGQDVSWKSLWPRFVLIVIMGIFDAQLFLMSRMEEPIKDKLEEYARQDVMHSDSVLESAIAQTEARKLPIRERVEIAEQKCEIYGINQEVARLNAELREAIALQGDEGSGVSGDRSSGETGMGTRYKVRGEQIDKLKEQIAAQEALLASAPTTPNCQVWQDEITKADTLIAGIDKEIARLREKKANEETRLMHPSRSADFLKWYSAFLDILNDSFGNFIFVLIVGLLIIAVYMTSATIAKMLPHTDYHDIMKAETQAATYAAEQRKITADQHIEQEERARREQARIHATNQVEAAQLEYETARLARLIELDRIKQDQRTAEISIAASQQDIVTEQLAAARATNSAADEIGVATTNNARMALAADMALMEELVRAKDQWITNLLALEPGLNSFEQQQRWNEFYKGKMGLI